jgi:protein TonB
MVDYKLRAIAALLAMTCVTGTSHADEKIPWPMPPDDFGGAEPKNRGEWISFEDYPSEAITSNHQGYVVVSFDITAKGRVENCHVTRSSGFKSLDAVPCPKLKRIARFKPATNANGEPIATKGSWSSAFWMP